MCVYVLVSSTPMVWIAQGQTGKGAKEKETNSCPHLAWEQRCVSFVIDGLGSNSLFLLKKI